MKNVYREKQIEKYQFLAHELQKMKVKIISIVIGVSGTSPQRLENFLQEIGMEGARFEY